MSSVAIRTKMLIWEAHSKVRPADGLPYEKWCEDQSKALGVSVRDIKNVVAAESTNLQLQVRAQTAAMAQSTAERIGLTQTIVLQTILDGLESTKEEVLYEAESVKDERSGTSFKRPMMNPDGTIRVHKQRDWNAISRFTAQAIDVLGMSAPEELNVMMTGKIDYTSLSDAELHKRANDFVTRLKELTPGSNGQLPPDAGGIVSEGSADRPLVLVDGVYQDKG